MERSADRGLYGGGGLEESRAAWNEPGWSNGAARWNSRPRQSVASTSWKAAPKEASASFKVGDRVFHDKFGNGTILALDGNKLEIDFDKAGIKKVLDSFVAAV